MEANVTNFKAALKTLYPAGIEKLYYQKNPFAALVKRDTKFTGEDAAIVINYSTTQGRSKTFSKAQGNKKQSSLVKFRIERKPDYSLASLSNELILASESDPGAIMPALKLEMDNAYDAAVNSEAYSLFNSGSGSRGTIAVIAGTKITLTKPSDIVYYEVGMKIELSLTDGGGAGVKTGSGEVASIDRDLGTFDLTAAVTTAIPTALVGDYIFAEGDYDLGMSGLAAWIPKVAPTSGDSFWGVDRSKDVTRLAGLRVDGSALPIEEAGLRAGTMLDTVGAKPDYWIMNPLDQENLIKSVGAKVIYIDVKSEFANVNFRGVALQVGNNVVKAISDRNCPVGDSWMIQLDTWELKSLGPSIRNLDIDGLKMLREGDADNVEFRIGGYKQLACNKPGYNAYVKLS